MEETKSPQQSTKPASLTDPKFDTPQSFPTPAHPLPRRLPKWLAVLLLIPVLVAFGFGIYSILNENKSSQSSTNKVIDSPKSSPTTTLNTTTNWKNYQNTFLSFRYPSDWATSGSIDGQGILIWSKPEYIALSQQQQQAFAKEDYATIEIGVYKEGITTAAGIINENTDLKQLATEMYGKDQYISSKDIMINNMKAVEFIKKRNVLKKDYPITAQDCPDMKTSCTIQDGTVKQVWLKNNIGVLVVSYNYGRGYADEEKLPKVFDQFLSTLKFLNTTDSF